MRNRDPANTSQTSQTSAQKEKRARGLSVPLGDAHTIARLALSGFFFTAISYTCGTNLAGVRGTIEPEVSIGQRQGRGRLGGGADLFPSRS